MTSATDKKMIYPIMDQQTPAVARIGGVSLEVNQLCERLLEYAKDNTQHVPLAGLAANQVAVDGERCTLNACFIRRPGGWLTALNPEILDKSGASLVHRERCLTWSGQKVIWAVRHECVRVRYMTLDSETHEEDIGGFEAIVWQHEVNHLAGVPEDVKKPLVSGKKIGANQPCQCGSGKKHKRCCGRL